jgi:hypothetical protein
VVEGWVSRLGPRTSLVDLSYTDPWDYSRDVAIDTTVLSDGHAIGNDDVRMFRLPVLQQPFASAFARDVIDEVKENKDRKFGMRMRATRLLSYTDTIELPPGWTIESLPDNVEIDNDAARLAFKTEKRDGALHCTYEVAIKNHMIPAEDYAGYYEVNKKLLELADSWVVCQVDGTLASRAAQGGNQGVDEKEVTR